MTPGRLPDSGPPPSPAVGTLPVGAGPEPGSVHERYVAERLAEVGRWATASGADGSGAASGVGPAGGAGAPTVADVVADHARARPGGLAYVAGAQRLTWRGYHERAERVAGALVAAGLARGDRLAVMMPDGPDVHVAYLAAERAGVIVVGIGPRAGLREVRHLLTTTGARALLTGPVHRGEPAGQLAGACREGPGLAGLSHLVLDGDQLHAGGAAVAGPTGDELADALSSRRIGVGDVFLLNPTSGTTGMPKCVVHHQDRWRYFHQLAVEAGALEPSDVWLSLVPAPFGFGIWTAHVSPTLLGCTTVLVPQFSPEEALALVERERVTVLCCVSTQFIMMLNSPALDDHDLTSLRCMFTGGEAVPFARAAEFEERTGAQVLQFYGSNETGALSRTTTADDRATRLGTAGRVIEGMDVRLFDDEGRDVTATGGPGQAACRGPATCLGYYADPAANVGLLTDDGYMLTGDLATIDADGVLRVVGRTSDFIIRGGKNISAAAVEELVASHPAVALAAAVAVPDEVFGERVCAYVELRPGYQLELDELVEHLLAQGASKEVLPERLVVDALPRASGGKVAKGELRRRAAALGPVT